MADPCRCSAMDLPCRPLRLHPLSVDWSVRTGSRTVEASAPPIRALRCKYRQIRPGRHRTVWAAEAWTDACCPARRLLGAMDTRAVR